MGNSGGSIWVTILPLIILLAVMYFLLIRPQKKREKEVNTMRSGVQVGDEIITIGGICGKVVKTKDDSLVIQVGADKVKFEIMRWSVSKVVEEGKKSKATPSDDEPTTKKAAKPKKLTKAAPVAEEPEEAAEPEASAEEAPVEETAEVNTAEENEEK